MLLFLVQNLECRTQIPQAHQDFWTQLEMNRHLRLAHVTRELNVTVPCLQRGCSAVGNVNSVRCWQITYSLPAHQSPVVNRIGQICSKTAESSFRLRFVWNLCGHRHGLNTILNQHNRRCACNSGIDGNEWHTAQ